MSTIPWRKLLGMFTFLFPAILALVASVLCVLFVKETDVFYAHRIKYLNKKINGEFKKEKMSKKEKLDCIISDLVCVKHLISKEKRCVT